MGMVMGQKERKRNGFTLLEVIIVLTLVVLILGLTTIYFAGFLPGVKFNATGREISAVIRHARSLARMNVQTERLIFDLDEKTYGFEGKDARTIPPHVLITITDPVFGEILHGKYRFVFYPSGAMEGGAISLTGGKKKMRIYLDPITGVVAIKNG
jgi:prepilin-type N-terminal cleavage/methylation domain-containing protein